MTCLLPCIHKASMISIKYWHLTDLYDKKLSQRSTSIIETEGYLQISALTREHFCVQYSVYLQKTSRMSCKWIKNSLQPHLFPFTISLSRLFRVLGGIIKDNAVGPTCICKYVHPNVNFLLVMTPLLSKSLPAGL